MAEKTIGIIGFGRFGKLLTKYLSEDFKVYVSSRSSKDSDIKRLNGVPASFEDICKKDVIIPSVPISAFEGTINKIKSLVKENALVIDVCSVKEYPVKIMKELLPEKIQILATHPLFGPDSASGSIKGRKIVLCKIRITDSCYQKIKSYLENKGIIVIETTPEEHDKETAVSLFLTHFVGRALSDFGAKELKIDTEGYNRLMKINDVVEHDSWQLFEDISHYNKYSKKAREDFIKSVSKINRRLEK